MSERITRRDFIKKAGAITAFALSGISVSNAETKSETGISKRILGRTGVEVSTLALGMGPIGISRMAQPDADKLINLCIDLGINYIDVAPTYGDGEEKLGSIMKQRRNEVFLVTKVEESSKEGALKQIRESLKKMQTDYIDAVHLHDFGGFDSGVVLGKNGALEGLIEAQRSGLIKFIGISGHQKPMNFLKALETDKFDLVMPVLNFVDRHTYNFQEKVLPEAIKRKVGVASMKVLGGAVGMQYDKPMPALIPEEHYAYAIRYALDLQGVATLVIGLKNEDEVRKAVETVKNYRPLSDAEKAKVGEIGKDLAKQWGAHFGPVE